MKKTVIALMLALMCILLCACTEKAPPETQPTETTAPTEPTLPPVSLKVGICLPGSELTWGAILKLLLLVVVDDNVRFHRDQLLLVKLTQVEQGQLIKLLIAEENLSGPRWRHQVGKPPPATEQGSWIK